jgi:hypothetical protein
MLAFEERFNKEREEQDKKVICFDCHKEGHTSTLVFFSFLISKASMTPFSKIKNIKSQKKI